MLVASDETSEMLAASYETFESRARRVPAASDDEASRVRAGRGETSERAESNAASEAENCGEDMTPEAT